MKIVDHVWSFVLVEYEDGYGWRSETSGDLGPSFETQKEAEDWLDKYLGSF